MRKSKQVNFRLYEDEVDLGKYNSINAKAIFLDAIAGINPIDTITNPTNYIDIPSASTKVPAVEKTRSKDLKDIDNILRE